jgi:hypothetical protein
VQRVHRVQRALAGAVVATIAGIAASPAHAVVQDYNKARGGDGFQVTHPGNGFFFATGTFDGRQFQPTPTGPPGASGEFFFAGSDGGYVLDVRAPLGQGATWDQSVNLATGDNGGYMHMDYFTTGTAGYPPPLDGMGNPLPPPYAVPGSFWFGGAGNDAGPWPAAAPGILAYVDVLAPAGKKFEFRIESDFTFQGNGFKWIGTGTGGWQTIGTGGPGGPEGFGSFDMLDPNLAMLVAFGTPLEGGELAWDSGGAFGSTPAVIRWDNLTFTPAASTWTAAGGGDWSTNSNWSALAPSGRNAVAILGPSAAPQTVTLDSGTVAPDGDNPYQNTFYVGTLEINNPAGYTFAGAEPLIIDTTAANGVDLSGPNGSISVIAGSHTISAPLRFNRTTNVDVAAGNSLTVTSDQTARPDAGLIKSGAGTLEMKHARAASLTVNDGVLRITDSGGVGSGVSYVGPLSIAAPARLDLRDNKLLTSTPAGTFSGGAYGGVQGEVARAYNFGAWDLPGLMTSEDLAGPNAGPLSGTTTIGVATGEQILFIAPTDTGVFAGQTITGATTIAMYTYAGDMNFDGLVDAADYGVIDNWVQFPGSDGYANGDLNYDGVIDAADYGIIDNTIQLQGAPLPGWDSAGSAAAAAGLSGVTAVPEPASLSVIALGAAGLLGRRRPRLDGRAS